jgi:hypothetical protein
VLRKDFSGEGRVMQAPRWLRVAGRLVVLQAVIVAVSGFLFLAPVVRSAPVLTLGIGAAIAVISIVIVFAGLAVARGRRWAYGVAWMLVVLGILGGLSQYLSLWNLAGFALSVLVGVFLVLGRREVTPV